MTRPTSSLVFKAIDFSVVSRSRRSSLMSDSAWSRLSTVGPRITQTRFVTSCSNGSDLIDIQTLQTSWISNDRFFATLKLSTDLDEMLHAPVFADDSACALSREVDGAACAFWILRIRSARSVFGAWLVRGRRAGRFFAPIWTHVDWELHFFSRTPQVQSESQKFVKSCSSKRILKKSQSDFNRYKWLSEAKLKYWSEVDGQKMNIFFILSPTHYL